MAKDSEVFYQRRGRQYIPIREHSPEWSRVIDSLPYGDHLISVRPNGRQYRQVDPALAPMIAAGVYAETAMRQAVFEAGEIRPYRKELTLEERAAFEQLKQASGLDSFFMSWPSTFDVVEAGIQALVKEAQQLMSNPAVADAYEQFMTVVQLTKAAETAEKT